MAVCSAIKVSEGVLARQFKVEVTGDFEPLFVSKAAGMPLLLLSLRRSMTAFAQPAANHSHLSLITLLYTSP
jgi:hypothetical protein